jgi:5'-3' exonuclease
LESIKGIGFKKAVKLIQIYGDDIKAICQDLKQTGQHNTFSIDEYIDEFLRAYLTFKHQVVYDISQQKLLHLTPLLSTHKSEEM